MFVTALPEAMDTAASGLATVGTTVAAGNAAGVYQATQAVGSMVHAMFVATMGASAASYGAAEGLNAVAMV